LFLSLEDRVGIGVVSQGFIVSPSSCLRTHFLIQYIPFAIALPSSSGGLWKNANDPGDSVVDFPFIWKYREGGAGGG
jgi:hypothetical protein